MKKYYLVTFHFSGIRYSSFPSLWEQEKQGPLCVTTHYAEIHSQSIWTSQQYGPQAWADTPSLLHSTPLGQLLPPENSHHTVPCCAALSTALTSNTDPLHTPLFTGAAKQAVTSQPSPDPSAENRVHKGQSVKAQQSVDLNVFIDACNSDTLYFFRHAGVKVARMFKFC